MNMCVRSPVYWWVGHAFVKNKENDVFDNTSVRQLGRSEISDFNAPTPYIVSKILMNVVSNFGIFFFYN